MNLAAVHTLLQLPPDPVSTGLMLGLLASQKVVTMKSGVSRVNSCTVFTLLMDRDVVL